MLINNLLFIHIPKCGGTSIEYGLVEASNISIFTKLYFKLLLWFYDLGKLYTTSRGLIFFPKWFNTILFKLGDFCNYHMLYSESNHDVSKTFTIIRHPQARLVSIYTFTKPNVSFNQFVELVILDKLEIIYPNVNSHILKRIFQSQSDFTQGLKKDRIFKLENLDTEWLQILKTFNLDHSSLQKYNTSNKNSWKKFYENDNTLVEKVYSYYQKDFEEFSYKKEFI